MVVSELRGEKIDIIPFNDEPARFVAKALAPARVREVLVDDDNQQATVIVPDDQLSLAIGREGQNARLAARLTGWRIDIRSESDFAVEDDGVEGEEESETAGRCHAILSNGRLCPNAALPGSRYCGLDAHQALIDQETDYVDPAMAERIEAEDSGEAAPELTENEAEAEEIAELDNETLEEELEEAAEGPLDAPEDPILEEAEPLDEITAAEEADGAAEGEESAIEAEAIVESIEDAPIADEDTEDEAEAALDSDEAEGLVAADPTEDDE
jgi:N utilization substance protein A